MLWNSFCDDELGPRCDDADDDDAYDVHSELAVVVDDFSKNVLVVVICASSFASTCASNFNLISFDLEFFVWFVLINLLIHIIIEIKDLLQLPSLAAFIVNKTTSSLPIDMLTLSSAGSSSFVSNTSS